MEWQVILALAIIVPAILMPVLFVWYLNIAGIYSAFKESRARRVTYKKEQRKLSSIEQRLAEQH